MPQVLVLHVRNARDDRAFEVVARRFPVLVGRGPYGVACVLDDAHVSKLHASLDLQDGRLLVRDAGSVNGTFADGKRLSTDWSPVGRADVPHEIRIRDWLITAHAEHRALLTEEMSLVERLGIQYINPNDIASTAIAQESAQTVGEGPADAAIRLRAVFDVYEQKALELYMQLSEFIGKTPPTARAAVCAHIETLLPGIKRNEGFARLFEQHRGSTDTETISQVAADGVKYLAHRYVGREPTSAQDTAIFLERIVGMIDATVHGHAPLLASLDRFDDQLALQKTSFQIPRSSNELKRWLFDWQQDPTAQNLRTFGQSFVDVAMRNVGMLNGFMRGVKVVLRELAPDTIRRHWKERQQRRDAVTRVTGSLRQAQELLALHAQRHSDLADEEGETFRLAFGREFAEEYAAFRQEEASDTASQNDAPTHYRDLNVGRR